MAEAPQHWPQVGVGVIIVRDGKVLVGKRKGAHGAGEWAFPGGKLDAFETLADCARREANEETGLTVTSVKLADVFTEDFFPDDGKHFITVYVLAEASGEPAVMEPDKCEAWRWFAWDELPEPPFNTLKNLKRQGYRPPGC